MADVTFIVTVPFGTGGGYYIDGVQKPIIPVVTGGTFRFNQNDSSNNTHPLALSTTTSTAGRITSGVVFYLDGVTTSANYNNITLFNAATVRYIEITVSQTSDFYYICNTHGAGMGNVMDITLDTWGALNWNDGNYGQQNNVNEALSGNNLTTSLGTAEAFHNEGWGRLTWSSLVWGQDFEDATVALTTPGTPTTWGYNTWGYGGYGQITGAQIDQGEEQANAELNALVDASTNLITVSVASLASFIFGDATLNLSTNLLNTSVGFTQENVGANTIVEVTAPGDLPWGTAEWGYGSWGNIGGMDIEQGGEEVVVPSIEVDTTGQVITLSIPAVGSITITGDANTSFSGIESIISLGDETAFTIIDVAVTGQTLTTSTGTLSGQFLTNVDVTGVELTGSTGTLFITAWEVVDINQTGTWTVVDIAA